MDQESFHSLLRRGAEFGASDVLCKVGQPPALRVSGMLRYLQTEKLKPAQTRALAEVVLATTRYNEPIEDLMQYDASYSVPGVGRYRVNVYRTRGSLALAMRYIPFELPDFSILGLPPAIPALADLQRGIVLVVGAAGNGKSTTLGAVVNRINETRRDHIITIEDPIEFLHRDKLSSVSQREVGLDTENFGSGLRAALRQDPDVILVGEIRDEETMDVAMKAAETGHLVLSTLHTPDVARTIGRVLSLCKGADESEIRQRFAENLQAIVAQRLVRGADGKSRVLAVEVLVATGTARESIQRPEGAPPLKEVMEKGVHPYGMQTFKMHLTQLLQQGRITVETARQTLG